MTREEEQEFARVLLGCTSLDAARREIRQRKEGSQAWEVLERALNGEPQPGGIPSFNVIAGRIESWAGARLASKDFSQAQHDAIVKSVRPPHG